MMSNFWSLAARCEIASGPDRELDNAIVNTMLQFYKGNSGYDFCEPDPETGAPVARRFTSSLDAALTLVPYGFDYQRFRAYDGTLASAQYFHTCVESAGASACSLHPDIIRACCAAAIRAHAMMEVK